MNDRYELVKEYYYNNNWYYKTKDGLLLMKKPSVCLPKSPVVSMTKYNYKSYFIVLEGDNIPGGLEKILKEDDSERS